MSNYIAQGTLDVPADAIPYLLQQRTSLQWFANSWLYMKFWRWIPRWLSRAVISAEARLRRRSICAGYSSQLSGEYLQLAPHIPDRVKLVLDIGCGVGGLDAFLAADSRLSEARFVLLDKSMQQAVVHYGFQDVGAYYNSLQAAEQLLVRNGVSKERIGLLEAEDSRKIKLQEPVNLVISLLSWGFHYPVAYYLPEVSRILAEDGAIVLDVRKGSDGIAVLTDAIGPCSIIASDDKADRVICRRVGNVAA